RGGVDCLANELIEDVKALVATWCGHNSPHSQRALLDDHPIIPELNGIPARLWKGTISDAEWDADHLQRVRPELDRPRPCLEDLFARVLKDANDVPLPPVRGLRSGQGTR